MTRPLDLRSFVQAVEETTGMLSGWPNPAQFPHVVPCPGLCPSMGYRRFQWTYHAVLAAAVQLAPRQFIAQATRRDGERVGYEFRFARQWDAARFALCLRAAMAGRPSSLVDGEPRLDPDDAVIPYSINGTDFGGGRDIVPPSQCEFRQENPAISWG